MARKKIKWQPGDNFLVPLEDGSYGQGQVLAYEAQAMNSAVCAFSSKRFGSLQDHLDGITDDESLIAVLFVTRDLLDSGRWHIVNNGLTMEWDKFIGIQARRDKGFIGTKIVGSFNPASLLNAYHGLVPWNKYHDPEYFDKLLASPDRKPSSLLMK